MPSVREPGDTARFDDIIKDAPEHVDGLVVVFGAVEVELSDGVGRRDAVREDLKEPE